MLPLNTFKRMVLKIKFYPCEPQMTFDPMIITWDMLGLIIGDYCGKIQLFRQSTPELYYQNKTGLRYWLTLQRIVVLTFRYRQHVNIADINMLSITKI